MTLMLLTEHHLECLGLNGGRTGSSEFTRVKMPLCWKLFVAAQYINGPTYEKTFLPNRAQSSLHSLYKDNSYHVKMVHA